LTKILVAYAIFEWPLRRTVADHLYSFRRYSRADCTYVNVAVPVSAWFLSRLKPDVIVFHNSLVAQRWEPRVMARIETRLRSLRDAKAVRVLIPQDEFVATDYLCEFIRSFRVDHVMTCAAEVARDQIYGSIPAPTPSFTRVLTGYLDDSMLRRVDQLATKTSRTVDVGYRSWHAEPWLGAHGRLKVEVAERTMDVAPGLGLTTDISTKVGDTIYGDDWYRFLLRCKATIGVEGGASILDRDGTLKDETRAFVAAHPNATYDQVEAACFPDRDGQFDLRAISPRHLEACATRTCQVLVEGEYNGILTAGTHYIPVKRDLSDLAGALQAAKDDAIRERIAENAYRDIASSRQYSYRVFVATVLEAALGGHDMESPKRSVRDVVGQVVVRVGDAASWAWIACRYLLARRVVNPLRTWRKQRLRKAG
jgi:hypothetical protein